MPNFNTRNCERVESQEKKRKERKIKEKDSLDKLCNEFCVNFDWLEKKRTHK